MRSLNNITTANDIVIDDRQDRSDVAGMLKLGSHVQQCMRLYLSPATALAASFSVEKSRLVQMPQGGICREISGGAPRIELGNSMLARLHRRWRLRRRHTSPAFTPIA